MPRPKFIKETRYEYALRTIAAHDSDECLIWPFATMGYGYGFCHASDRSVVLIHRLAFFVTHGRWPVPQAMHSCDVHACYNPRHLTEGTAQQNNDHKTAIGRSRGPSWINHRSVKLTPTIVKAIRADKLTTHRELAKRFHVHETTILQIRKGKYWKHVK